MNMSVKQIAKSFGMDIKKGEIDYAKPRPIGYIPTKEENEYQELDVKIVGRGLKFFRDNNLEKMTIAGNALNEYKNIIGKKYFERWYPKQQNYIEIRQSYKGGFVYVNPKYKDKIIECSGEIYDVNSLYPYVMYTKPIPYGDPIYYEGEYDGDGLYNVYIQLFRCQFEIKPDKIPTIQIKSNCFNFSKTEYLENSSTDDPEILEEVILCLTSVDLVLFFEQYNVYNYEAICGYKYKSSTKLFTGYIDKYMEMKIQADKDGNMGLRLIAKLLNNSLYGKFAKNPFTGKKHPVYLQNEDFIHYEIEKDKLIYDDMGNIITGFDIEDTLYLPVATFITAYARDITIRAAQENYDIFMYADTDSLHLCGTPKNIKIHKNDLGAWKFEGYFNKARYIRAKTYIENIIMSAEEYLKILFNPDIEDKSIYKYNIEKNYYEVRKITCAGLPSDCHTHVDFNNFKRGTKVKGKKVMKRVSGGIILEEGEFTIKF